MGRIDGLKECSACGLTKPLKEFHSCSKVKDGKQAKCKLCRSSQMKAHYTENRNRVLARNKEWNKQNRASVNASYKKWQIENAKKYYYTKYHSDTQYRVYHCILSGIHRSISTKKQGHWFTYLGYSLEHLINHLEGKFKEGMSWQNYGEWHIDHIIPISAFEFTSPMDLDFKLCWDLKNLQPLWAVDNLRKGNTND